MSETKIPHEPNDLPKKITRADLAPKTDKNSQIKYWMRAILHIMISSLLVSFAAYSLIVPNEFTIGGAGGIAILVNVASGGKIPQSIVSFSINLPLVVLAFFFVKRRFAVLTALNIAGQTLWLLLFEQVFPDFRITFPGGEASKIFAAVAAGVCFGIAIPLAFKVGGSTGGADILAVLIQKKLAAGSIAWLLFIINCTIIGSSVFVFYELDESGNILYGATLLPIIMATFEAYIESKTNETITNGFQSAIEFRIITDKPEEMATAMMKELSRGVTAIPATGMYTKIAHTMLLCVISRRQVAALKRIMKTVDPDSFAVTSKVSQVLGLGFFANEE